MNAVQANAISISEILNRLGYAPQKPRGRDCLFFSPLHGERTPGFYIDLVENVWFDFGEERGGDVVDFAQTFLESRLHSHGVLLSLQGFILRTCDVAQIVNFKHRAAIVNHREAIASGERTS